MSLALLLVDLQGPLLATVPEGPAVLARCRLAVAAAQLLDLPVVVTEQAPEKLGSTEASVLSLLGPTPSLFAKTSFSALGAPGLLNHLRDLKIDHVLLAGLEGPICIHQTAVHALAESIGVTVMGDAVGARRSSDQELVWENLRRAGVTILPVETIFYSLLVESQHPKFKAFTSLVKQAQA